MKAIGIVRRIDELGRIVIPIELRRNMRLKSSDEMEMFVDNNGDIILKKFSKLSIEQAALLKIVRVLGKKYSASMVTNTGNIIVNYAKTGEMLDGKPISNALEKKIQERKMQKLSGNDKIILYIGEITEYEYQLIVPINIQGDIYGSLIVLSDKEFSDCDMQLAEIFATYVEYNIE